MMIDQAIKTLKAIGAPALKSAQRDERVIKALKALNLDPIQPPADFDGVYVYTLVEYGIDKPEVILKFFREKEIRKIFLEGFNSTDSANVILTESEKFLEGFKIGDDIRATGINYRLEIQEFIQEFIKVARRAKGLDINQTLANFSSPKESFSYPDEFKALIYEKTRSFCGRKFVFDEFEEFLKNHSKGYFTVIGDAGIGKSSLVAQYVSLYKVPSYFNILAEGRNRPELFIKSIRQQLIECYGLQQANNDDLPTLLEKVSKKLAVEEKLIIMVDALDEVEQEPGENLLYLPGSLPDKVYFFLTRRPYTLQTKRLRVEVSTKDLDLSDGKYEQFNREDIREYINFFLTNDPEHKSNLRQWIKSRQLLAQEFIEKVADKSENNFMYLRYILPAIAKGDYNDLQLKELPNGLQEYYQIHWERMGMNEDPQELKVIILFILVEIGTPIPLEMLAEISQEDEVKVGKILDEWVEYVKPKEIDGEECYGIYHKSFLDFLTDKREFKRTRKIFQDVNQRIVDYFASQGG